MLLKTKLAKVLILLCYSKIRARYMCNWLLKGYVRLAGTLGVRAFAWWLGGYR